jgi:hypothetical protein
VSFKGHEINININAKTGSNFKIKENQQNIEYIALKKVPDISTHTLTYGK